jgi:hypothetical protein
VPLRARDGSDEYAVYALNDQNVRCPLPTPVDKHMTGNQR